MRRTERLANLERINQIVGLQAIIVPQKGADGTQVAPALDASVIDAINKYTVAVLEDISKDKLEGDEDRVTNTFINASARAKALLLPDKIKLGNVDRIDAPTSVDTNIQQPPPSSGATTGNAPYTSVKAKPTTFSKIINFFTNRGE